MIPQQPQHLHLDVVGSHANPYLIEHLQFMQEQESTHYRVRDDYLRRNSRICAVALSDCRAMVSWSYGIVDACSIDREIACITASNLDRFMGTSSPRARAALISRRDFQLAFISCLIVMLKCRAGIQVDSDFVSGTICQGMYREDEIAEMEEDVLSALQWRLSGPSPHDFIVGLIELMLSRKAGSSKDEAVAESLRSAAKARVENDMLDYSAVLRTPSSIAYDALLTAMKNMSIITFHPLDRLTWMRNIAW